MYTKMFSFEFDDNSKITVDELKSQGYSITELKLKDGRILLLPHKSKQAVCCPECFGTGEDLEDSSKDCCECRGTGYILED